MRPSLKIAVTVLLFSASSARAQNVTKGVGYQTQAANPCAALYPTTPCMWTDTANKQIQFFDGATAKTVPSVVTATKGDLAVWNGTIWQKLAVGVNGTSLVADNAQATGMKWQADSIETLATTYAAGTVAADQTMVVAAADGGPPVCKAAAPATGALFQTQTSTGSVLASFADDGLQTNTRLAISTTQTPALALVNSTAAAAGAQQYSPLLESCGQGWKTDAAAASQPVCVGVQTRPVEGAANPSGAYDIRTNINNAGYGTPIASFYSDNHTDFAGYITTPAGGPGGIFNTAATQGLTFGGGGFAAQTSGGGLGPAAAFVQDLGSATSSWGFTYLLHIIGKASAAPLCTPNAGAGVGATCTMLANSNDVAGEVELVTGAGVAATASLITIAFNNAYNTAPHCLIWPSNLGAQASIAVAPFVTANATSFDLNTGAVAIPDATTFHYNYHCIE